MYKKIVCLLMLSLSVFGTMKAQENIKNDNPVNPRWFVSGGVNGIAALNGSASNELGVKLSGGVWVNRIIGVRLSINAGNNWLKGDYTAFNCGGSVDVLFNLLKNYANQEKKFNLAAAYGVELNYYNMPDDYPTTTSIGSFTYKFSLQASWKLNKHVALFAEPGIRFSPKYYGKSNDPYVAGTLSVGAIYNF